MTTRSKILIAGLGLLFITYLVVMIKTTETIFTTPEKDITCVKVKGILGTTETGCYRGNIHKSNNCIDLKMTYKHQPNAIILYFEKDLCKEEGTYE